MPTATNRGVDLYYEHDGPDREPVAFVGEAGLGAWLWGWQHPAVAGRFGAVVFDLRGTGRSAVPEGPYSVGDLAADLEAVLAARPVGRAHLVGAGLGGMVALEYALEYGRAATLTLFGTAAAGADLSGGSDGGESVDPDADGKPSGDPDRNGGPSGDPVPDGDRPDAVGPNVLCADPDDRTALRRSLSALLSREFRAEQPDVVEGILDWRAAEDAPPEACRWQVAAMEAFDRHDRLHEVTLPALVVHGGADRVVPPVAGRRLAASLPRGAFERLDGAGHLAFVERSRPVNDRLVGFLDAHSRHVD